MSDQWYRTWSNYSFQFDLCLSCFGSMSVRISLANTVFCKGIQLSTVLNLINFSLSKYCVSVSLSNHYEVVQKARIHRKITAYMGASGCRWLGRLTMGIACLHSYRLSLDPHCLYPILVLYPFLCLYVYIWTWWSPIITLQQRYLPSENLVSGKRLDEQLS